MFDTVINDGQYLYQASIMLESSLSGGHGALVIQDKYHSGAFLSCCAPESAASPFMEVYGMHSSPAGPVASSMLSSEVLGFNCGVSVERMQHMRALEPGMSIELVSRNAFASSASPYNLPTSAMLTVSPGGDLLVDGVPFSANSHGIDYYVKGVYR